MLGVDLVEVVDNEAVLLDVADRGQVRVVRVLRGRIQWRNFGFKNGLKNS